MHVLPWLTSAVGSYHIVFREHVERHYLNSGLTADQRGESFFLLGVAALGVLPDQMHSGKRYPDT